MRTHAAWTKGGVLAVLALAVFSAGAGAAWLTIASTPPKSLSGSEPSSTVRLVQRDFPDQRSVQLTFTTDESAPITAGAAGRVTTTMCSVGASLQSGQALLFVDQRPIILLATSVPLWRDISRNDSGEDVKALQVELTRIGYSVPANGVAGSSTLNAVAKLFRASGDKNFASGSIPTEQLAWIPKSNITTATCPSPPGTYIQAADTLMTMDKGLTKVSVVQMPVSITPGDRLLEVDSISVPIDQNGVVSDPDSLAKLASTPTYGEYLTSAGTSGVSSSATGIDGSGSASTGNLVLAKPIKIGVVPPTAVYSISGGKACVSSARQSFAVTIVGSQLGQTYVQFETPDRPSRVDISPKKQSACR